jgi:CRP/FNR family transcriptional regulator, cyclic AMP receptor protein
MKSLQSIIENHPFFKDLEPHFLELVTGCASNVRFEAGESIFRQGDDANQFYLIRQGKVALEVCPPNCDPVVVQTTSDGEILGWAWIVPPYHYHCDAVAIELTRAIQFDGQCLRKKCETDHSLGYTVLSRLLPIIGKTMEATQLQLTDIYGNRS